MGRSAGLVTLVLSLVMSAVLLASQWSGTHGPAAPTAGNSGPVARATAAAAEATQILADRELAAYQAEHGTFEGAQVNGISGVTVRSADASGYCLQIESGGSTLYDAGPGGSLSARPCG
jgi:hypothetical protein